MTVFFRYNFRPEVDNDVISGMAVDDVSVDVCVKYGADFVSNEHDRGLPYWGAYTNPWEGYRMGLSRPRLPLNWSWGRVGNFLFQI